MHLAMELLKQAAGIDLLHVPFKGSGPAYPEVFAGRIDLLVDPLFASLPYVKAGRTKAIAVTSAKRAPQLPDVQTVAETIPGFEVQSFFGIVVPGRTPRAIVNKLNADVVKVVHLPEMRGKLAELGLEPVGDTPDQFDATIRSEIDKWAKVVKTAGIQAD
jgi:tripartite-type tricarboxylate transporter receptor subunit TctC